MTKIKAFTLIEILVGIALLSLIGLFILPAAYKNIEEANKVKDMTMITYSMQEAIEEAKIDELAGTKHINGNDIEVSVKAYRDDPDMVEIVASYKDKYIFRLVKEKNDK